MQLRNARYETRHVFHYNTTLDCKAATGDKATFLVSHPFILIEEIGYHVMTAPGAVTTAGVFNLDKQGKDNGSRAIANSLAVLTFNGNKSVYGVVSVPLNAGASNSPPTRSFPLAVAGDQLIWELVTQGVGAGAQDIRPYIIYREMPASGVQG